MRVFESIPKIDTPDELLDIAFRRGKTRAAYMKQKKFSKDQAARSKQIELVRIECVKDQLVNRFEKIVESFPQSDEMHEFYRELMKCTIDFDQWKKSLGAVRWAIKQVKALWMNYTRQIRRAEDKETPLKLSKAYYGRVSSVVKQIKKNLATLDQSRIAMRKYPSIKTGLPTVVIAGFPNVGKTTLLSKLTGSTAEIKPYAFTTKNLNLGYIFKNKKRVLQLLDAPGTLNRFNKMNSIEKQSYLALKYLAEKIIYVFDPTEAYPIEVQIKLYNQIKKDLPQKEIICYLSKTDIVKNYKGPALEFNPLSLTQLKKRLNEVITSFVCSDNTEPDQ